MRIKRRVDKPNRTLSNIRSSLINDGHDGTERRRTSRSAKDKREAAIDGHNVVSAIGGNVRVGTSHHGVVVAVGTVRRVELGEVVFDGSGLVGGQGEDIGEAATGEDDGFAGLFGLGDGGVGDDLGGADGGDVGAGAGERGVEDTGGAVVVLAGFGVDALAAVTCDAEVAGGVEDGGAGHAELGVFLALAAFVEGGQVGFVVAVGGGDDFGGGEAAAGLGALVAAGEGVRVDTVLSGVVAAFEGAVGTVDAVEEIVEGGALGKVADLVEGDGDRVDERHGVFEVEVGFTVEIEGFVVCLVDTAIDGVEDGGSLDLVLGEVGEEEVEVTLEVCLGCIFDDTVGVLLLVAGANRWDLVKGSETVGNDAFVAVGQIGNHRFDIDVGTFFRKRGRTRSAKLCCSAREDFRSHF